MTRPIRPHVALALLVCTFASGAECGRTERACVDLREQWVEVTLEDPIECGVSPLLACTSFSIPERFVVRVLDEPAQRRALPCEIYRAEIVSGAFDGLELLGPTDGTLSVGGDFAVAELVRVEGTDCFGRLFISFARIQPAGGQEPEDLLAPPPDGVPVWAMELEFDPTDEDACAAVQSRCVNNRCGIFAAPVDGSRP
jgi:hypothetical protein